jgi:methyl-accepting chemotaxis protein
LSYTCAEFDILEGSLHLVKLSVRNKLGACGLALLLIPSLAIGLISMNAAQSKVKEEIVNTATSNVDLFNHMLTSSMQANKDAVDFLANDFNGKEDNDATIVTELNRFAKSHVNFMHTYLGTDKGTFLQRPYAKMPAGYDPRKRPWYQQAMENRGKVVITPPYKDASSGKMVVTVAETLPDGHGVVGADITLDALTKTAQQVNIGSMGYLSLFDASHHVIVSRAFKPGTEEHVSALNPIFQQTSGQVQWNGQEILYTTNPLTGWKVAGVMYNQEITNAAAPIRNTTILVIIITLVLGVILGYFVLQSITKPLKVLVEATKKIGQGDLTQKVPVKSTDEFGRLGEGFNHMIDSLRTLIDEVRTTSEHLAASSEELAASADENAKAAEQIAMTVEQAAAGAEQQVQEVESSQRAAEDINQGMHSIAHSTQVVASSAMEASEASTAGVRSIESVVAQMNSIHKTITELGDIIQGLGERSRTIGKIVETITGIADQTNLLALNAAIEAARAGESGRGFAVVADEVRKLAERCTESSKRIESLIRDIQNEIEKAVESMEVSTREVEVGQDTVNAAGETFGRIKREVETVVAQAQEVSAATQQIMGSTEQLQHVMSEVAAISDRTAAGMQTISASTEEQLASMEEITASAESLTRIAEQLQGLIGRFTV